MIHEQHEQQQMPSLAVQLIELEQPRFLLIIFDADGTLVTTRSGATFRKDEADWKWLPDRVTTLRNLRARGIHTAIATNQGGVAIGKLDEEIMGYELRCMLVEGYVEALYVCYSLDKPYAREPYRRVDLRRKPAPGMLLEAMQKFGVEPADTLMVGDRDEDREAAMNAGVTFMRAEDFFPKRDELGNPIPIDDLQIEEG